jgi:hypothetical protein
METKEIFAVIFLLAGLIGGIAYLITSIWEFIEDWFKVKKPETEVSQETLIFMPGESDSLPFATKEFFENNYYNVQFIYIPGMKNKLEIWCYENEKLIETLEIA